MEGAQAGRGEMEAVGAASATGARPRPAAAGRRRNRPQVAAPPRSAAAGVEPHRRGAPARAAEGGSTPPQPGDKTAPPAASPPALPSPCPPSRRERGVTAGGALFSAAAADGGGPPPAGRAPCRRTGGGRRRRARPARLGRGSPATLSAGRGAAVTRGAPRRRLLHTPLAGRPHSGGAPQRVGFLEKGRGSKKKRATAAPRLPHPAGPRRTTLPPRERPAGSRGLVGAPSETAEADDPPPPPRRASCRGPPATGLPAAAAIIKYVGPDTVQSTHPVGHIPHCGRSVWEGTADRAEIRSLGRRRPTTEAAAQGGGRPAGPEDARAVEIMARPPPSEWSS